MEKVKHTDLQLLAHLIVHEDETEDLIDKIARETGTDREVIQRAANGRCRDIFGDDYDSPRVA